jgi:hypothetical protein
VTELLKPFTSVREFVTAMFSWGLWLAVALGIYVVCVFPSVEHTAVAQRGARALHHAGIRPEWFLIGLLISLTIGLSAGSRWVYQVLEGIQWPRAVRERRERTHSLQWGVLTAQSRLEEAQSRLEYASQELADERERSKSVTSEQERASVMNAITAFTSEKDAVEHEVKDAEGALTDALTLRRARPLAGFRRNRPPLFVLREVGDYPAHNEWVRATRLGNRIRAFETDGVQRYGLDPLALWYELLVTAPGDLADNIQGARQGVELWVGAWSAAVSLAAVSTATEILAAIAPGGHAFVAPVVVTALACIAALGAYRAATAATDEWRFAVNALVNLGRWPLARAYGLEIPASFDEEKIMWEALTGYVLYGTQAYAERLDDYRGQGGLDIASVPSGRAQSPPAPE